MCVPDVTKNINVRVFSLMARTIERRHIKRHETYKYKCSLGASVFNNKQRWNKDKCWFKCKELIEKGVCNKGFIWNPSNCELECNKSCNLSEYLDYENWKCRKILIAKLVEEYTAIVEQAKIAGITLFEHEKVFKSSCTIYIVLVANIFTINIGIGTYFVCYKYFNRTKENISRYDYVYQATNFQYKWEISKKLILKI